MYDMFTPSVTTDTFNEEDKVFWIIRIKNNLNVLHSNVCDDVLKMNL